jgi:hypothetical protein
MARKLNEPEEQLFAEVLVTKDESRCLEDNVFWAELMTRRDSEMVDSSELQELFKRHCPGRPPF